MFRVPLWLRFLLRPIDRRMETTVAEFMARFDEEERRLMEEGEGLSPSDPADGDARD